MLEWYKDDNIGILFSSYPKVSIRYIHPYMFEGEKNDIKAKPFINESNLEVILMDLTKDKVYEFEISKNYCWDGASIPRIFWRLIGSKTDNRFLIPSLIHDVLCENHHYVDNDRYFATKVFERLLYVSSVSPFNRWLMFHSTDNFQKFCNWKKEK